MQTKLFKDKAAGVGRLVVSDAGARGRLDQAPTAAASHQVQVLPAALTPDPGDALEG